MNRPQLVLLVGAPRSGTTWLQSMLGARREVATPQETDLFSRYVAPLAEAWSWQLRGSPEDWRIRRYKGLPGVLDASEFRELVTAMIDRVLEGVTKLAPEATIVVEKSPAHSLCAELVADYAPRTRVIHLVRDGRDVAASMTAAAGGWGRGWAPVDVETAARSWVRHVEGARDYRLIGFRYREVRYESLLAGDVEVLRDLFEFLDLPLDAEQCARVYDEFGLDRMRTRVAEDPILLGGEFAAHAGDRAEPEGFFRGGGSGSWRESWSAGERLTFRTVAGTELERLGYERDGRWAATSTQAFAHWLGTTTRRGIGGTARRLGRAADRLGRGLS